MEYLNKLRLALASLIIPSYAMGSTVDKQPNIIVIILDDLGLRDVSFNGSKDIITPNIDRIANEGTHCTNAYVSAPYSGPSRCGIFTGRYQQRFGAECNILDHAESVTQQCGVPKSEMMLTEALKEVGYQTAVIGKWHMGDHVDLKPNMRGADYFYGFSNGSFNYWGQPFKGNYIEENNEEVPASKTSYLTDDLTEKSLDFINMASKSEDPFFLYLSYNAPHAPMQATEQYLERTTHISDAWRSIYAAMILGVDDGVGRIWDALESKGIEDETMIIFLSDNGGTNRAMNYPQRSFKGNMYDGGTKVPFAIYWKEQVPGGKEYNQMISGLDIYPTVTAAAGIKHHKNPLDGTDLMPFLKGHKKQKPHEQLFFRVSGGFEYAVRDSKYKLVKRYDQPVMLYNLENDPYEMIDIASQNTQRVKSMQADYDDWNAQMIKPRWMDDHDKNQIKDNEFWMMERKRSLKPQKK